MRTLTFRWTYVKPLHSSLHPPNRRTTREEFEISPQRDFPQQRMVFDIFAVDVLVPDPTRHISASSSALLKAPDNFLFLLQQPLFQPKVD